MFPKLLPRARFIIRQTRQIAYEEKKWSTKIKKKGKRAYETQNEEGIRLAMPNRGAAAH